MGKREFNHEVKNITQEENPGAKKHSLMREILSYAVIIAAAVFVAQACNRFVLINACIPSESMENLLMVNDRIFGWRLSYLVHGPERYDVVMFKYPVNESEIYIKRVIGLPGETVEIKDGYIYIDGSDTPIEEDYLPEEWVADNDGYVFEVPQDCYLMLGDNRNISEDARFWAQKALEKGVASDKEAAQAYTYVHVDKIIGRAILKYYPEFDLFLNISLP